MHMQDPYPSLSLSPLPPGGDYYLVANDFVPYIDIQVSHPCTWSCLQLAQLMTGGAWLLVLGRAQLLLLMLIGTLPHSH